MKVAYLTTCFGTQSHTFIRREVLALRNLGLAICLYGIRKDPFGTAADAESLVDETNYLYPLKAVPIIKANLKYLARSPLYYLRGALAAVTSKEFGLKRRAKMLFHYFVATTVADKIVAAGVTHVHAHFMNVSTSVAMYAAYHSRIPFSVTVHSAGEYKAPHVLGADQKLKMAQFLIMISHFNVDYFDAIWPCREKSYVIRCGMNLSDFTYRGARPTYSNSVIKLLGVGRMVEKKGFLYLIEAAALLKEKQVSFILTLIGDGPLATELKQLAQRLNVTDVVHFAGKKHSGEVRAAMADADVVIVPSVTSASGEKEGLPVVIMEAMATGVPVVASAHSGIPEIVLPNKTGYLTPEKDSQAIADAIQSIIKNPSPELVEDAYQLVERSFNIDRIAEQRLALFSRYHNNC